MATLTPESPLRAANDVTLASAASGGDEFVNDGKTLILALNSSGAPITITVVTQATVDGLAVTDLTLAVGAGDYGWFGPFPTGIYNDGDGKVQLTYSTHTDLSLLPMKSA